MHTPLQTVATAGRQLMVGGCTTVKMEAVRVKQTISLHRININFGLVGPSIEKATRIVDLLKIRVLLLCNDDPR
jgi:hypothetical protein